MKRRSFLKAVSATVFGATGVDMTQATDVLKVENTPQPDTNNKLYPSDQFCIGSRAGTNVLSGDRNVAIGYQAMTTTTTGSR